MVQDQGGYQKAADEFEAVAKLAPKWTAPYFNLGVIYSKMDKWDDALRNYNQYLDLSPHAKDAEKVKAEIYKLEYKKEQQSDKSRFSGEWCGVFNPSTRFCDFNLYFQQMPNNKALYHLDAWCANEDDCGSDTGWSIAVNDLAIGADNKFDAMGVITKKQGENETVIGSGRVMGSFSDKDSNAEGKDLINVGFLFKGEWYSLVFKRAGN
jgi:tetratricopeptide (TPR) repeat protein